MDGNKVVVVSYGPDGDSDTEDDIYSHNHKEQ